MAPPSATHQSSPTATAAVTETTSTGNNPSSSTQPSAQQQSSSSSSTSASVHPFSDRILAAEHRFTSLTQNIAHFSPLKTQLDRHNITIERLENEIKEKTALLQSCQNKLKSMAKRPQNSRQGSNISLHASEEAETEALLAQQQATKEILESLNGQLLAAKILHIGLTRQVAQYFESRSELQTLLEQIFSGSTPEHPKEDALERELEQISAEIVKVKEDFANHRAAKNELKEIRRYVDIWNDAVEKQVASNAKGVSKSLKKFVPFFGPKPPSYTKIADNHMANARTFVPTLEDIGLLSDINMETIADTSSELIIYTARFRDSYNALSHELEVLYKRSRVLKKKKNQSIEKLFDERCKIFSEELQAHYRSVGESLVSGSGSTLVGEDGAVTTAQGAHLYGANGGSGGGAGSGARLAVHRQHVETSLESYSSEGSSLGHNSQEMLLGDEELPSYFQHEHEAEAEAASRHRRTFSLGSPAHSSSASSSLSLHSPMPMHTTDSPPDYVRDEQHAGPSYSATVMTASGSSVSGAAGEDEDAQFLAYHRRYDTHRRQGSNARTAATTTTTTTVAARSRSRANTANAMDMPPGYEETRFHSVVDPV